MNPATIDLLIAILMCLAVGFAIMGQVEFERLERKFNWRERFPEMYW